MIPVLVTTPLTLGAVILLSYAARWMRRSRPVPPSPAAEPARPPIHAEITEVTAFDPSYQADEGGEYE